MKYIIKGEDVIGIIRRGNPNMADLESRGESVVESDTIVSIPARYVDGELIQIEQIVELTPEGEVNVLINDKIREMAVTELVKEGKITSDKKLVASK